MMITSIPTNKRNVWIIVIAISFIFAGGCPPSPEDDQKKTPDNIAPTISSKSPSNDADSISISPTIIIIFSEKMDPSTINGTNITLKDSIGNSIGGKVSLSNNTATFNPSNDLNFSTTYTVTVGTGVKDIAGNNLASASSWSFTTTASWVGAQQIGTTESDLAYSIFVDPSDNIFITGFTDGNLLNHTNNGRDIFLIKFTENGSISSSKLIGAKPYYKIDSMGNTNRIVPEDRGYGVFVNSSGNIYLTGLTSGYLSGPTGRILNANGQIYTTSGSTFTIRYTHTYDGFIIGMDKNLDQVWAHQTNEISNCCGNIQKMSDNTIDRLGNIYIVGETNVYDFDGNIRDNAQFGGDNNRDIILVKYDSDGQKQWSSRTGTNLDDNAGSIIVDSLGNIYICWFGSYDGYITKYDSEGNQLRFTRIMTPYMNGSYGGESFLDIKIDNEDNIYVVGGTTGWLDGNRNLGGEDIIIIKFYSNLSKLWSRQLGSSSNDSAISLAVNNNEIFILGSSDGNFDGKQQIGERDIVLIKFNSDGEKQWVRQLGTDKYDSPQDIAVNSRGDLFITGWTMGAFEGKNSEGKGDIFVIKYDSDGNKQ